MGGTSSRCPRASTPGKNFSAADAVYVGDSEVDVSTARNAGLPLVAVSWGFRSRRTLTEAGAETIADTAAELLEKLQ